eukprot:TRINITY_DN2269_c0_g1_i1.p1 TRINITY_DN2269_c0_g1~~TRINITY_DN2269_c0_g1_i1.p1  ORF type:complete len:377 (-),score=64.41 TRINITY_DN2269_c0_g1_i1:39-1169(-)
MEWPIYLEKEREDTLPRSTDFGTALPSSSTLKRRSSSALFMGSLTRSGSFRSFLSRTQSHDSISDDFFQTNRQLYHKLPHTIQQPKRTKQPPARPPQHPHHLDNFANDTKQDKFQSTEEILVLPDFENDTDTDTDTTMNSNININDNHNHNHNTPYHFDQQNITNLNPPNNVNAQGNIINPSDNFTKPSYDYSFLIHLSTPKLDPTATITTKELADVLKSTDCFSRIVWYSCLVNGKKFNTKEAHHFECKEPIPPTPRKKREHHFRIKLSQSYHRHSQDFRSKLPHFSAPTFIVHHSTDTPLPNNFITREPILSGDNMVSSASGPDSLFIENAFRRRSLAPVEPQPIIHYIVKKVKKKKALCRLPHFFHCFHSAFE